MYPFFAQDVVNAKTVSILAHCFNNKPYEEHGIHFIISLGILC
jgi:hypothetical protein